MFREINDGTVFKRFGYLVRTCKLETNLLTMLKIAEISNDLAVELMQQLLEMFCDVHKDLDAENIVEMCAVFEAYYDVFSFHPSVAQVFLKFAKVSTV
jgi:hypothetical protein